MVTDTVGTARKTLWVAEAGYDEEGALVTDAGGLDTMLDANARLFARGKQPAWVPFALCETLEGAQAACDALARMVQDRKAKESGPPAREPGEDG
jgi:hypothetical protein